VTGNYQDAEEATQEALLKAYLNLKRFRAESRFYTWLTRITLNESLMKLRKRRTERVLLWQDFARKGDEDGNEAMQQVVDPDVNPEERCAGMELQDVFIQKALRVLGPTLYRSFILQCVQDYSVKETTEILGITEAALKSRTLRARRKLQRGVAQRLLGSRAVPHPLQHRGASSD
jgi:RNA polymerase sigma-70 factor (ECF subfamily)